MNNILALSNTTDLITEYIPLESLETEYLVNSGNLYQPEHNEHDYISSVLVENVHEEIVSSTCCDESSVMKTEKGSDDELSNISNFHNIIVTCANAHSVESVVTTRDSISPSKSKSSSQIPANIIFSDKTLNTIVLAPSSNTPVRISRLPMSQNKTPSNKTTVSLPASPDKSTPMKTIVSGSKNNSYSSNIPGLSYALYPNTSVSNTASVSSALRGTRTSTIVCSSISSIVSPKQQALSSLTSPTSTCSPVKKIILQKPTKQLSKNGNPPTSISPGAYVEIHSSPPPLTKIATSSSSLLSQSSSTASSSSTSRSVASASSSQTIVIYTSPSPNHPVSTSSTSKNLMKTSTISCTANNALALRPSSASMVTVARTIVIGTTSAHQTSCSNTISSTVRSTIANSTLRPVVSSHNGGNTRAINISKHVATNTVRHISQRSIGVNTQQPSPMQSLGTNTPLRDIKPMKVALGIDVSGRKVLLHKPVARTTSGQLPASSSSVQVTEPSAEFFKMLDVASCATKVGLKRPRDVSPPTLSPTDDIGDHLSFDHPAFRSDKRECLSYDPATMEPKRKINLIPNYEEQIGGSCPSSTNRELQAAVVVGEDAEPLTSPEGEFVHSEIVKQLKKALEAPDCPELRFLNSGMVESGWYMCTCQDSTSLDWLLSLEPMQLIEGRSLRVVRATDLPWPSQVGFQIQGNDIDPESVLSLLQRQNKKLKTRKWNILEKREELNGTFLSYFIDPDSVQALEEYQWILCYELATIHVHLLKGSVGIHWKEIKEEIIIPENGMEIY